MNKASDMQKPTKRFDWRVFQNVLLGILLVVFLSIVSYSLGSLLLGEEKFRNYANESGIWGPLFVILLKSSTQIFAPLGGGFIYVTSGLIFGFWQAYVYTVVGDLLGMTVSFWIARKLGRKVILKFAGKKSIETIDNIYNKFGNVGAIVLMRFIIQDLVNYAAGLSKINFTRYLLISMGTQLIMNLVIVSFMFFPSASLEIKALYGFGILAYALFFAYYWYKISRSKGLEDEILKST